MTDIAKRMRQRKAFGLNGATWIILNAPDSECQEAANEIEQQQAEIKRLQAMSIEAFRLGVVAQDKVKRLNRINLLLKENERVLLDRVKKLEASEQLIRFIAGKNNTGSLTINGKVVELKHRDGKPLQAGDLVPGVVYEFDRETGELIEPSSHGN